MDEYAGRVLADRYRLPLPPSDEYDLVETRAFDTYSGQEVLVRQVPLPEVVDAEVLDADGRPAPRRASGGATRSHSDPAVRRAIEAAQSAAQIPDHPRLDQVFDVFAEGGSLWIVSELVAARPLAALLAEAPLNPFRAAEIASDVLTAVRVLHAHGWTHRNITVRTVLVCDDGRVVLTGLAAGAAEEALCGYAPVPEPPGRAAPPVAYEQAPPGHGGFGDYGEQPSGPVVPGQPGHGMTGRDEAAAGSAGRAAPETSRAEHPYGGAASSGTSGAMPRPQAGTPGVPPPFGGGPALPGGSASGDIRAARAGAIAAYRAGTRAAARVTEDQQRTGEDQQHTGEEQQRTGAEQAGPARGANPDPDWWARPPQGAGEADAGEDGTGSAPHRAELAGTWREGPAPWNDASGSVPAGGSPYGPHSAGPFGGGRGDAAGPGQDRPDTRGIPVAGPGQDRSGGVPASGAPALPPGFTEAAGHPGGLPALPPAGGAGIPATMARTGGEPPYSAPGGGSWQSSGTNDALRADARRRTERPPAPAGHPAAAGRWDEIVASGSVPAYRGPATPLAAERARQARIAIVGGVTERWAPEQAGPVHDNWRLAPPIGPATDLWALGALLYRAVQGHAPYPEENATELVQLVCTEPPAFAEECGPLRPVVESLLRQDPTERPDYEELRGWLRSLVRSAPEPEAGQDIVQVPSVDGRLPIVRRRGELVRKRRRGDPGHGRHRQKKTRERGGAAAAAERWQDPGGAGQEDRSGRTVRPERQRTDPGQSGRGPRSLGRLLLVLILLALVAAVLYAVMFMPKAGTQQGQSVGEAIPRVSAPAGSPDRPGAAGEEGGSATGEPGVSASGKPKDTDSAAPRTSDPAVDLIDGYVLRDDPEGFRIAVDKDWQRRPINDSGQVRYVGGDFTLVVVPGRDTVAANGGDPMVYQRDKERELQPYRDSSWASASGLRRIDVGRQAMAEGQFTWQDSSGREVYVRNLAVVIGGRYHVIQVIGPDGERDRVSEIYQQATTAYRESR